MTGEDTTEWQLKPQVSLEDNETFSAEMQYRLTTEQAASADQALTKARRRHRRGRRSLERQGRITDEGQRDDRNSLHPHLRGLTDFSEDKAVGNRLSHHEQKSIIERQD